MRIKRDSDFFNTNNWADESSRLVSRGNEQRWTDGIQEEKAGRGLWEGDWESRDF